MRKFIFIFAAVFSIGGVIPAASQNAVPFPPFEAVTIVRSIGLRPLGPPLRRGPTYVMRAIDPYGEGVRVTIDAWSGEVLSAVPVLLPPNRTAYYRPYAPPPPGYHAPYEPPIMDEDEEDYEVELEDRLVPLRPPRVIKAPRETRPRSAALAPAKVPAKPPLPRPRPTTLSQAPAAASSKPESKPESIPQPTPEVPPVVPLE